MSESLDQEIRTLRDHFWSVRDPEGRAFVPLAEAYRQLGELAEAASLVQDGLDRLPDFASGHLVASRVARDCGDLLAAREHLDRVLDLDPENVLALLERADARASEADAEGAALDLQAALELEPGNEAALRRLSELEDSRWAALLKDGPPVAPGSPIVNEGPVGREAVDSMVVAPPLIPVPPVSEEGGGPDEGDAASDPFASEESEEDAFLMTRTMAELYVKQGLLERALEVLAQLVDADPDDEGLRHRLREVGALAGDAAGGEKGSGSAVPTSESPEPEQEDAIAEPPRVSAAPTEDALKAPEEVSEKDAVPPAREASGRERISAIAGGGPPLASPEGSRTIAHYLQDLLAWVPGAVPIASLAPEGLEGSSKPPTSPTRPAQVDIGRSAGSADRDERESDEFDAWLRSLSP